MAGSVRSYEFARRLVRDGHEVHIVTSKRDSSSSEKKWDEQLFEGIYIHSTPLPYNNAMSAAQRIRAFLTFAARSSKRARTLDADVVFATSTPLTIVLPALAATYRRDTPFVMEVRDLWPAVPIAMGFLRNPVARYAARLLEKVAYNKASRIIALSDGMAEGVRKVAGSSKSVTVVPNVSDTQRFHSKCSSDEEFESRYPELVNQPFVVYTGTFGRVNGLEYMVQLARECAAIDSDLAFVAMGDGAEKQSVIDCADRLGVLNVNFFVYDPLPKKDLPMVLARATACSSWVIPVEELEANSANKLFDAFAARKPMVINHGGWQKELLESTGAGIALPAADYHRAAQELVSALGDDGWLERAGEASARLGVEEFEVEKLYGRFAQVLISTQGTSAGKNVEQPSSSGKGNVSG